MESKVSFASPLSVDDILARLDERAREWRASKLPPELRRTYTIRVRIRRTGRQFRLDPLGGQQRWYLPALVGSIQPDGNGARIEAHFAASRDTIGTLVAGSVIVLVMALLAHTILFIIAGIVCLPSSYLIFRTRTVTERRGLERILREVAGVAIEPSSASSSSPST